MYWPQLIPGTLINRYKRFLADVQLSDGTLVTAHCANSGRMTACNEPGRTVYLSSHDNPKRKLPYTWELIDMGSSLVGVNTMVPNRLVAEAVAAEKIPELTGYETIEKEVRVGRRSRLDLKLVKPQSPSCYVEIKNCTLVEKERAMFPDAVTVRGRKHLKELESLVEEGHRCVMFFLIQRMDAGQFAPADHIDPIYGETLRHAAGKGVEMVAYDVDIDLTQIQINHRLSIIL